MIPREFSGQRIQNDIICFFRIVTRTGKWKSRGFRMLDEGFLY